MPSSNMLLPVVLIVGLAFVPLTGRANETAPDDLSPEALDALVAGVAFYPDATVEQALAAATTPQAIEAAAGATASEFAASQQQYPASIIYLHEQEPALLGQLAEHLSWTARLGVAVQHQLDDVWAAVDRVRAGYKAASEDPAAADGATVYPATPYTNAYVAGLYTNDVHHELHRYYHPAHTTVYHAGGNTAVVNTQGAAGAATVGNTTYFGSAGAADISTSGGRQAAAQHIGGGTVEQNADGTTSWDRNAATNIQSNRGATDIEHTGSGTYAGGGDGSYEGSTEIDSTHGSATVDTQYEDRQLDTSVTTDQGTKSYTSGQEQARSTARPANSEGDRWSSATASRFDDARRATSDGWGSLSERSRQATARPATSRPTDAARPSDSQRNPATARPNNPSGVNRSRPTESPNFSTPSRATPSRSTPSRSAPSRSSGGGRRR